MNGSCDEWFVYDVFRMIDSCNEKKENEQYRQRQIATSAGFDCVHEYQKAFPSLPRTSPVISESAWRDRVLSRCEKK